MKRVLAGAGARRAGARTAAAADADMPVKAPASAAGVRLDRTSISAPMPATAAATPSAVLSRSVPSPRPATRFGGLIGGVQAGYNVQLPSGLLLGVEADVTFPNYLDLEFGRLVAGDAAHPTSPSRWTMSAPRAAASAMPAGPWLALRHRRPRLCRRALSQHAGRSATTKSSSTCGSAGPPAPASNMPSRRTGALRLEYLYSQFERRQRRASRPARNIRSTLDFQSLRIGLNRKIDWPGSAELRRRRRR